MLGRHVVDELTARGHGVRILSRNAPARELPGVVHRPIDLATGVGVPAALEDVELLIESANRAGTRKQVAPVIVDGTARLLRAAVAAGVRHVVAISIVGIDSVPFSYYRAKLEQERIVEQGDVPWSMVRATQFPQLLDAVFSATARIGVVPTATFPMRPVDPRFVATVLADAAEHGPAGRLPSVAGPEVTTLAELARTWKQIEHRHALAVHLPMKPSARRALVAGALIPGDDAQTGGAAFGEWLRERSSEMSDRLPGTAEAIG